MYLQKFKKLQNSSKIEIKSINLNKNLYFNFENKNNFNNFIFKINYKYINIKVLNNVKYLYFNNLSIFKTIFNTFFLKIKDIIKGFYLELELKGLGYTVFFFKNYLFFDLNYSHFIAIKVPKDIIIKRFKGKLIIFGFNRLTIMSFSKQILKLKKIDIYKGKGIFIKGKIIKLKEIKKK